MDGDRVTVATAIFAPTARLETIVRASIEATEAEFPDDVRLALVDYASADLLGRLARGGWEIITIQEGQPPRMGSLLCSAVNTCRTRLIWTIEHDVEVHPGARALLPEVLAAHPELAGVEAMTVNACGRRAYPSANKRMQPMADPRLLRLPRWASLCCVCWRVEALRPIDWRLVPDYPATDQVISRLLRRAGWELAVAPGATALHHYSQARGELPDGWRDRVGKAQ